MTPLFLRQFSSSLYIGAAVLIGASAIALSTGSTAQEANPAANGQSPTQLIHEAISNELKAEQDDHSMWRFKRVMVENGGTCVYEVIDTPEGQLQRLVAENGQPISAIDVQKQDDHMAHLVSDPNDLHKLFDNQQNDVQQEHRLLEMLPEAFIYTYAGREGHLIKLDFQPNPSFQAQHREGEVFHHMDGSIWVDASQMRIARLEGRLGSEVKFAGGLLGHLAPGGTFAMEQTDLGSGRWELTHLDVNMNGEVLFLKTIHVHQNERDSDFQPVAPGTSPEQAAQQLKRPAPQEESSSSYELGRRPAVVNDGDKAPVSVPTADPKRVVFPKDMHNFA